MTPEELKNEDDRLRQWEADLTAQAERQAKEGETLLAQAKAGCAKKLAEIAEREAALAPKEAALIAKEGVVAGRELAVRDREEAAGKSEAHAAASLAVLHETEARVNEASRVLADATTQQVVSRHAAEAELIRQRTVWEESRNAQEARMAADRASFITQLEDVARTRTQIAETQRTLNLALQDAETLKQKLATEVSARESAVASRVDEAASREDALRKETDAFHETQRTVEGQTRANQERSAALESLGRSLEKARLDSEILEGKVQKVRRMIKAVVEAGNLRASLEPLVPAEELGDVLA